MRRFVSIALVMAAAISPALWFWGQSTPAQRPRTSAKPLPGVGQWIELEKELPTLPSLSDVERRRLFESLNSNVRKPKPRTWAALEIEGFISRPLLQHVLDSSQDFPSGILEPCYTDLKTPAGLADTGTWQKTVKLRRVDIDHVACEQSWRMELYWKLDGYPRLDGKRTQLFAIPSEFATSRTSTRIGRSEDNPINLDGLTALAGQERWPLSPITCPALFGGVPAFVSSVPPTVCAKLGLDNAPFDVVAWSLGAATAAPSSMSSTPDNIILIVEDAMPQRLRRIFVIRQGLLKLFVQYDDFADRAAEQIPNTTSLIRSGLNKDSDGDDIEFTNSLKCQITSIAN